MPEMRGDEILVFPVRPGDDEENLVILNGILVRTDNPRVLCDAICALENAGYTENAERYLNDFKSTSSGSMRVKMMVVRKELVKQYTAARKTLMEGVADSVEMTRIALSGDRENLCTALSLFRNVFEIQLSVAFGCDDLDDPCDRISRRIDVGRAAVTGTWEFVKRFRPLGTSKAPRELVLLERDLVRESDRVVDHVVRLVQELVGLMVADEASLSSRMKEAGVRFPDLMIRDFSSRFDSLSVKKVTCPWKIVIVPGTPPTPSCPVVGVELVTEGANGGVAYAASCEDAAAFVTGLDSAVKVFAAASSPGGRANIAARDKFRKAVEDRGGDWIEPASIPGISGALGRTDWAPGVGSGLDAFPRMVHFFGWP